MPLLSRLAKESVELTGGDLAGACIGTSDSMTELQGIHFHRTRLKDVDLSYAELSVGFNLSYLRRVDFTHAYFDRCQMRKATLLECDFAGARLIVDLTDTLCQQCRFAAAVFYGGRIGHEYGGRRVRFVDCDFSNATFERVEFRASRFINCTLSGAHFVACDLRGVKLEGTAAPEAGQFEAMDAPAWAG